MYNLRAVLEQTENARTAVAHFNVSDWIFLKAVVASARELKVPVIVGASELERAFVGVPQLAALVKSFREENDFPIFLNADHTHSLQGAVEAAKAGFDSVVFDRSELPFEENIQTTRRAVEELKSINLAIIVEGEIGDIGTGSAIHDSAPEGSRPLTTPEEARQFVQSTGVDVLAPAVGNMHGMLQTMVRGSARKRLDLARIREIKSATGTWLTLHGGSGTDDEDLRSSMAAGINIIHINTELRVAWRRGLESAFAQNPHEVVPYKLLPFSEESIRNVVTARLRLFNHQETQESAAGNGTPRSQDDNYAAAG
jgi:fructose-bisphosphate aldolase class II